MHAQKRYWYLLVLSALGLAVLACGSLAPPEECPNSGFDEEAFAAHFNDMQLVNAATGEPGELEPGNDQGMRFSSDDELALLVDSLGEVQVPLCIQQRNGGGQIVYNETHSFQEGESTVPLMAFDSDPYVIRVILNDALIKNLTFFTE